MNRYLERFEGELQPSSEKIDQYECRICLFRPSLASMAHGEEYRTEPQSSRSYGTLTLTRDALIFKPLPQKMPKPTVSGSTVSNDRSMRVSQIYETMRSSRLRTSERMSTIKKLEDMTDGPVIILTERILDVQSIKSSIDTETAIRIVYTDSLPQDKASNTADYSIIEIYDIAIPSSMCYRIMKTIQDVFILRSMRMYKPATKWSKKRQYFDEEYYVEALQSFHHLTTKPNKYSDLNGSLNELWDLLNELSDEVITDLQLKNIIFKSREMIIALLDLLKRVVKSPVTNSTQGWLYRPGMQDNRRSYDGTRSSSSIAANIDEITRRQASIDRLTTIRYIFLLFLHLFISSSELSSSSFVFDSSVLYALALPLPSYPSFSCCSDSLGLHHWINHLSADLSQDILSSLSKSPENYQEKVEKEIDQSIESLTIKLAVRKSKLSQQSQQAISLGKIADIILHPVNEMLEDWDAKLRLDPYLLQLRRSVFDLQSMVFLQVMETTLCCDGTTRNIGEIFIRTDSWRKYIDNLVFRISEVLDDILRSKAVSSKAHRVAINMDESEIPKHRITPVLPTTLESDSFHQSISRSSRIYTKSMKCNRLMEDEDNEEDGIEISDEFEYVKVETQEIVMYSTLKLLHHLIADSYKVREYMNEEMGSFWPSIHQVIQTLVPSDELWSDTVSRSSNDVMGSSIISDRSLILSRRICDEISNALNTPADGSDGV